MPVLTTYRFGIYFVSFLIGYYVFSHDEVQARMEKICLPMLGPAVLGAEYFIPAASNYLRGDSMAKKGMARPDWTKTPKNNAPPVPELQGKAKHTKKKAEPIVAGTGGPDLKVFHEKPIPDVYSTIDTDLARDNLENDIPAADLEDL